MPRAYINGVLLLVESYGSGVPLVLAYGLGGNTGLWAGQIEPQAGHLSNLDAPEAFNTSVLDFLRQITL
jgi:hypothetical protein